MDRDVRHHATVWFNVTTSQATVLVDIVNLAGKEQTVKNPVMAVIMDGAVERHATVRTSVIQSMARALMVDVSLAGKE